MKIRNGFVSNSSSSSFLLVGVEADKVTLSTEELEDMGFSFACDCELVGVHWYISEYDTKDVSVQQITDAAQKVRDKLGVEPRVYAGMEYS